MLAAGLPEQLLRDEPGGRQRDTSRTNGNTTKYDSLQMTFRRALSDGLAVDANYVFAHALCLDARHAAARSRCSCSPPAGVPHALKMTVIYDLPFGRGQRFGTSVNPWVDGAIGGWSLNLAARVQSGTVLNFGNVRLVGMSLDELQRRLQDPDRSGDEDRVHAAAGHHRQHDQGVQRERDVARPATARPDRRADATSRRRTVRTASRKSAATARRMTSSSRARCSRAST